jgi:hypothetical protein
MQDDDKSNHEYVIVQKQARVYEKNKKLSLTLHGECNTRLPKVNTAIFTDESVKSLKIKIIVFHPLLLLLLFHFILIDESKFFH